MDEAAFLTDPMFSERASPFRPRDRRAWCRRAFPGRAALTSALVSHDHYDHADPCRCARSSRGTRIIVPLGMADVVRAAGGKATELDWWEDIEIAGVRIHCVPAQHFSGRGLTDRNRRLWAGWVVEGPTRRFYHAGDTGYFGGFTEIGTRLGPFDLAAIPVGAYRPSAMMRPVHLDPEEAVQAALDLRASRALAMHFGTFDLTDEPLDEPPARFLAEAARRGLGDRAWVLRGDTGVVIASYAGSAPRRRRATRCDDPARDRARPGRRPPLGLPRRKVPNGRGRRPRRPHRDRQRRTRGVRLRPRHLDHPLQVDERGRFSVAGTFVPEHGGPVRPGEVPESRPARYQGLDRQKLEFTVTSRTDGPGPLRGHTGQGAEADEVPVRGRL
jgi:N-acyl-phosphatidylethanolamine-hydrolysing phospholipase D